MASPQALSYRDCPPFNQMYTGFYTPRGRPPPRGGDPGFLTHRPTSSGERHVALGPTTHLSFDPATGIPPQRELPVAFHNRAPDTLPVGIGGVSQMSQYRDMHFIPAPLPPIGETEQQPLHQGFRHFHAPPPAPVPHLHAQCHLVTPRFTETSLTPSSISSPRPSHHPAFLQGPCSTSSRVPEKTLQTERGPTAATWPMHNPSQPQAHLYSHQECTSFKQPSSIPPPSRVPSPYQATTTKITESLAATSVFRSPRPSGPSASIVPSIGHPSPFPPPSQLHSTGPGLSCSSARTPHTAYSATPPQSARVPCQPRKDIPPIPAEPLPPPLTSPRFPTPTAPASYQAPRPHSTALPLPTRSPQHRDTSSIQSARKARRLVEGYEIGRTIGEGTFGKVRAGRHVLTQEKVAIKVLEKNKLAQNVAVQRVARELHILKKVRHPHVIQLLEIIETPSAFYLIMEYAANGELFDYIVEHRRLDERTACKMMHQLLSGVEELHCGVGVVHRDLKPENLLLDEDLNIKIVDFGLSNTYDFRKGQRLLTACGSPCYAAPEMIAGHPYVPLRTDLWSCGVILYALVCGFLPFEDPDTIALYRKILAAEYTIPPWISPRCTSLIRGLLTVDPSRRFTLSDVRRHPWYSQVCDIPPLHSLPLSVPPSRLYNGGSFASCELRSCALCAVWESEGDGVPDEKILLLMTKLGYSKKDVAQELKSSKHNHCTTTYYLLQKKMIRQNRTDSVAESATSRLTRKSGKTRYEANAERQRQREGTRGETSSDLDSISGEEYHAGTPMSNGTTSRFPFARPARAVYPPQTADSHDQLVAAIRETQHAATANGGNRCEPLILTRKGDGVDSGRGQSNLNGRASVAPRSGQLSTGTVSPRGSGTTSVKAPPLPSLAGLPPPLTNLCQPITSRLENPIQDTTPGFIPPVSTPKALSIQSFASPPDPLTQSSKRASDLSGEASLTHAPALRNAAAPEYPKRDPHVKEPKRYDVIETPRDRVPPLVPSLDLTKMLEGNSRSPRSSTVDEGTSESPLPTSMPPLPGRPMSGSPGTARSTPRQREVLPPAADASTPRVIVTDADEDDSSFASPLTTPKMPVDPGRLSPISTSKAASHVGEVGPRAALRLACGRQSNAPTADVGTRKEKELPRGAPSIDASARCTARTYALPRFEGDTHQVTRAGGDQNAVQDPTRAPEDHKHQIPYGGMRTSWGLSGSATWRDNRPNPTPALHGMPQLQNERHMPNTNPHTAGCYEGFRGITSATPPKTVSATYYTLTEKQEASQTSPLVPATPRHRLPENVMNPHLPQPAVVPPLSISHPPHEGTGSIRSWQPFPTQPSVLTQSHKIPRTIWSSMPSCPWAEARTTPTRALR